ncbi:MAG: DNRLRE domain-containing protein [Bacteroidia bacterium]
MDAQIHSNSPTVNRAHFPSNVIYGWTNGGQPGVKRSLIQFDLGSIPSNATISHAALSLFYDGTETDANGVHSGSNAAFIKRITSSWVDTTVNWNNQPATTTLHQVLMAPSSSPTQDYTGIDVTALVQDMHAGNNYGFMIQLQNENPYAALIFGSKDHPDPAIWPVLRVCYDVLNSNETLIDEPLLIHFFPVPATHTLNIRSNMQHDCLMLVFDAQGKKILERQISPGQNIFDIHHWTSGVYFGRIQDDGRWFSKSFLVK